MCVPIRAYTYAHMHTHKSHFIPYFEDSDFALFLILRQKKLSGRCESGNRDGEAWQGRDWSGVYKTRIGNGS